MVAFENAMALTRHGAICHTLCFSGSPLEKHLREQNLPTVSLKRRGFWDFIQVRRFLRKNKVQCLLIQLLKDLRMLAVALTGLDHIQVFAISHTLINVNKKDLFHRWTYGKLSKLICLTELHKQNLLQHLPLREEQMEILPNFVDCELFNPRHRSEAVRQSMGGVRGIPLMGIASRLDPQKGQDTALQAMAILKRKNIPLHLVIVGENTLNEMNYLEVLKSMTRQLNLEDCVHFTGYRRDMANVVASMDALVMPSHCETFGRVLIEAMASRTAVIATRAGGVPNIIDSEDCGLLVPPQDSEALADAMERVSQDAAFRLKLAEGGLRKVLSTYSREIVEEKLFRILGL